MPSSNILEAEDKPLMGLFRFFYHDRPEPNQIIAPVGMFSHYIHHDIRCGTAA